MYATRLPCLYGLKKRLVSLHRYEVLQHPVADEIEALLIEPSVVSIDIKATVEISHFILVVTTAFVERLSIERPPIELDVQGFMACSAKSDSVAQLVLTIRKSGTTKNMMRLDTLRRLAMHASIAISHPDEAPPQSQAPPHRTLRIDSPIQCNSRSL
ncbi:hypothetical protein QK408_15390 [Pseudomonas aeruginosa]|nr:MULTISPECIES: hypothetical protein [Pseudomonas]MDI4071473.1 hypothetical protein [Pseudomonas aeruginosa]